MLSVSSVTMCVVGLESDTKVGTGLTSSLEAECSDVTEYSKDRHNDTHSDTHCEDKMKQCQSVL